MWHFFFATAEGFPRLGQITINICNRLYRFYRLKQYPTCSLKKFVAQGEGAVIARLELHARFGGLFYLDLLSVAFFFFAAVKGFPQLGKITI